MDWGWQTEESSNLEVALYIEARIPGFESLLHTMRPLYVK